MVDGLVPIQFWYFADLRADIDVFLSARFSCNCNCCNMLYQSVKSSSYHFIDNIAVPPDNQLDHFYSQAGAHFVIPTTVDLPPVILMLILMFFQLGACCNCNCCNVLKVWVATSSNTLTTLLVRREPTLWSRPPWTCLQSSLRSIAGSLWDSDHRLRFVETRPRF